ncbi:hypothetical protein L218DRAFT_893492 [Marasmius fiardii PR-910]|nr:hypothetical protein L218DRAFT_893492 [Marasmius fiardii PR-910]
MVRSTVEDEQGLKKRRLQNACDECRRRKIRCDSASAPRNICSNCLSLRIECTHQTQKKKRGPKIGPANDCRALVNAILSSSKPYVPPEDPEMVAELLVKLANHARSLDRQLSELSHAIRSDSKSSSTTGSPAASNDASSPPAQNEQSEVEDSIDSLTQELKGLTVNKFFNKRHFGKSSNFMLVQAAMDSRRDVLGDPGFILTVFAKQKRPEFWKAHPWQSKPHRKDPPLIFPEDDLLFDLVNIYFTNVNPVFPLLHRPTFGRSIADGLHLRDRSFGATVLAVCAIGARQSNDPRNLSEGTTSEHSLGWKWFSQIPLVRDSFTDPPSLYDLQLLSLSVIYLQMTSTPEAAWTLVGIGIRSAQEMGVHRKSVHPHNTVEDELWKRAFWLLVSIDLFYSTFMGRPRATTSDDFDVDLPIECDDEYWESSDPQKAFVQPVGKPSVVSLFSTLLRLLDIVSFAQRTLYAVRKSELWSGMEVSGIDWKRKAVMQLGEYYLVVNGEYDIIRSSDSALNKFVDTIPEHLKWNPENPDPVFFQQSAMLHAIYHWVQIQIHRPFIPRPGQDAVLALPSLEICTNAARKVIHIIQTLQSRSDSGSVTLDITSYIMTPLFASSLILLLGIWSRKQETATLDSPKEMVDVYRSLKLIQKYESRSAFAGRVSDILNAVITIGQLPRTNRNRTNGERQVPPSHAQRVLEDMHDAFHKQGSTPVPDTPTQTSSHNSSTMTDTLASSSSPGSSPTGDVLSGMFNANGPPQNQTDFLMQDLGLSASVADMALFDNNFTASQFMLQPQSIPAMLNPVWNTPGPSTWPGNMDLTQEDWDTFMASVNDIMTQTMEYRTY